MREIFCDRSRSYDAFDILADEMGIDSENASSEEKMLIFRTIDRHIAEADPVTRDPFIKMRKCVICRKRMYPECSLEGLCLTRMFKFVSGENENYTLIHKRCAVELNGMDVAEYLWCNGIRTGIPQKLISLMEFCYGQISKRRKRAFYKCNNLLDRSKSDKKLWKYISDPEHDLCFRVMLVDTILDSKTSDRTYKCLSEMVRLFISTYGVSF